MIPVHIHIPLLVWLIYDRHLFRSEDCSDDPHYYQVTGGSGPMYPDQSLTWKTFRCDGPS